MRLSLTFFLVFSTLGCGGGGGTDAPTEALTLLPVPALTGRVRFPLSVTSDASLIAGDDATNLETRAYAGIDLTVLPAGVRIESARMQLSFAGANGYPWPDLGNLAVDHLDLGAILDPDDFNAPAFESAFAIVPPMDLDTTKVDVNVAAQIQRDLDAGRTESGFRFRFSTPTDDDDSNDFAVLSGSDSLIGPHPYVVIVFRR